MNKKGFEDGIFYIVIIVVIVLFGIIAGLMFQEFRDNSGLEENNSDVTRAIAPVQTLFNNWQNLLILLMMGITIALFLSVFILPSGPVFKFAAIIMILVMVVMAAQFANVFETIHDDPGDVGDYSQTYFSRPATIIADHYPQFILVIMALAFVFLVGKTRNESQGL